MPSGDSKGEAKNRTYCPTTWTYSYQWQHAAEYADQLHNESLASSLLCKECTLLVRIQLSKKSASHPPCAFADSASTVMCGAMVSLTPCIAPTCDRECDLEEYAEFQDLDDMITKLNGILSKSEGFPRIPVPRKECHQLVLPADKRCKQYVICPEQDCECLVYMSDQNTSMVEAIGLHDHPWWRKRVEEFTCSWYTKSLKASKDAWTWEEGMLHSSVLLHRSMAVRLPSGPELVQGSSKSTSDAEDRESRPADVQIHAEKGLRLLILTSMAQSKALSSFQHGSLHSRNVQQQQQQ